MKYKPEEYINSGYWGPEDDGFVSFATKVVKCRKPHKCMGGCETEIQPGEHALLETGILDGKAVSCHTCLPCIDKWLDHLHSIGALNV